MTPPEGTLDLHEGMVRSCMTYQELWLRQLGMGGEAGRLEVEAYVLGVLSVDSYQHDLLAQSLNEHFMEIGEDHPVGYWRTAPVQ